MKRWRTKSGYDIIMILSGRSNVYLLTNGEKNILIDTSVSRLWNRLQQKLDKLGINSIDYLIVKLVGFVPFLFDIVWYFMIEYVFSVYKNAYL
jgi:uncharacterized membrane-anchored protein